MKAVLLMMIAGLRKNKLQTGVYAAGCFWCTFLLLGAVILNVAIEPSFDKTYEKLNAPNINIRIGETVVTEEELQLFMEQLTYVEDYTISKSYLASNVKTPHESMEFAFVVAETDSVLTEGKVNVNKGTHCAAGDRIEFSINGKTAAFEVDSVVMDAVNSAPEAMVPYFRIDKSVLEGLTQGYEKGNWLIEAKCESGTAAEFILDYENCFGQPFDGEITSYEDIKHSYLFRYEIFSELFLFLFVFFFCMMLVMTVLFFKMAVRADLKKIGIVKALGFTKQQTCIVYGLRYYLVAVIAGTMGIVASGVVQNAWLSGIFRNVNKELFHIEGLGYYRLLVFLMFSGSLYLTVRLSMGKMMNLSPVDAINERQRAKRTYLPGIFLPAPRFVEMNLGLLKSIHRRLETLFVFVLTLGVSLLFLTSFYVIDSVSHAHAHIEDWGIAEMDIYISRKTNADEAQSGLLEALQQDKAVDFYYAALSDHISYRLEGSSMTCKVVGDVYDKRIPEELEYRFIEGRNPQNVKEAAIGINFAKQNKLGIGDTFYMIRNGEETQLKIVGIYPSFRQYGNSIRVITDDIKGFFGNLANGYYSVVLQEGEDINAFAGRMSEAFTDFDFFPMEKSNVSAVNMLLLPLGACILVFAVIFMLILLCLKKLMLMECKNDFLTYRFTGFSLKKRKAVLQWRFDIPVFVGMILAIPLSVYAMPVWMSPLARQLGLLQIPVYPSVLLVGTALLGVWGCSRIRPRMEA